MSFYVWMMSVDYSDIERNNMAFSAWFFHISVAIAAGGRRYSGAASLDALHMARFVKISPTTVQENHPHDVTIAKIAPNY